MNGSLAHKKAFLMAALMVVWSAAFTVQADSQISVKAVQITSEQPQAYQVFVGTTRAANRVTLRPQINGRLVDRFVDLGQRVEQGEVVAKIYNPGASALASAANQRWLRSKVELAQAEKDVHRIKTLFDAGAASKQEYENTDSAYQAAVAAEQAASSQASQASQQDQEQVIRAPFSGVVTATPVEPGEVIQMGQELLQIADPEQVEIEVATSAAVAARLAVGDDVKITLETLNRDQFMVGQITELTPFRERGALPSVVIRLPNNNVLPGQTAYIHIPEYLEHQIALPLSAVVKVGASRSGVYRISPQQKVELVFVEPQRLVANQVLVKGDLAVDDWVVTAGVQRLFDGALVEVVP